MKSQMLLSFTLLVFSFWTVEGAPVAVVGKTRQFIPPLPGYIPVYIRPGNTPLEEINLDLAEAFRSYALKQARLNALRSLSENVVTEDAKHDNDFRNSLINITLEEEENNTSILEKQRPSVHIQKIPRN